MVRISIKPGQIIEVVFALRTPLTPNKQLLQQQPVRIKAAARGPATAATKSLNFRTSGYPKIQSEKKWL